MAADKTHKPVDTQEITADAPAHEQATAHTETAHHDSHDKPFYLDSSFWVAVAFVAFIVAVYRPLAKKIIEALDGRADKIKQQLAEAEQLKKEAQATLAEYRKKQKEAFEEAKAIVDAAKNQAEELQKQASKNLDELLKRRERQALMRISQAESQAINEVRHLAVDVAVAATRQLLQEKLSVSDIEELVEKSVDRLPEKVH